MQCELWAQLSQAISQITCRWVNSNYDTYSTGAIVRVQLWAKINDKPTSWACDRRNWDARILPKPLPDQATMSRRTRRKDFLQFMDRLSSHLAGHPTQCLVKFVDGKPLEIPAHSTDRHAAWGRGAGHLVKGYKLHTIWSDRSMPEQWRITPLNANEKEMARRMIIRLDGSGYLLGDSNYDSSKLYDAAAQMKHQLVAPRKYPYRGIGRHYQSPYRRHSIDLLEMGDESSFGQKLYKERKGIERRYGNLSSFGGGLYGLPPWVRGIHRVRIHVYCKLLINAARIRLLKQKENHA